MSRLSPVTGYQNLLSEPTEVGTRTTLLSGLRCTNYATKTTIATTVLIVLLISLHMTSRLNRNKHGCFLLGKCVRTGANKLVVNGRNQEPLLLLRLASGASPLNAANSSDTFFCFAGLLDERQIATLVFYAQALAYDVIGLKTL